MAFLWYLGVLVEYSADPLRQNNRKMAAVTTSRQYSRSNHSFQIQHRGNRSHNN